MFRIKTLLKIILFIGVSLFLFGCTATEEPESIPEVLATETETPIPPKDTPIPQTETLVPPTETPTPEAIIVLQEVQVTACEELAGTWLPEKFGYNILKYTPNCSVVLTDANGTIYDQGTLQFDGDVALLESDYCTKPNEAGTGIITYTCVGKYKLFLMTDGENPVKLRHELIEDENDIRAGMTSQFWVNESASGAIYLTEKQATTCEELAGTWLPEKFGNNILKYTPNCSSVLTDANGTIYDQGTLQFEGDMALLESDYCTKPNEAGTGIITYTCVGKYNVYIAWDGDAPFSHRYELIEDENVIRAGLVSQNWLYESE